MSATSTTSATLNSTEQGSWPAPAAGIIGGYNGESLVLKVFIACLLGLSAYNTVELHVLIFVTFTKYSGLYCCVYDRRFVGSRTVWTRLPVEVLQSHNWCQSMGGSVVADGGMVCHGDGTKCGAVESSRLHLLVEGGKITNG
jgi:hypothetical protein